MNWRCFFKHRWRYFIDPQPKWPEPREVRNYGKVCTRCRKEVIFFTSQPRSEF